MPRFRGREKDRGYSDHYYPNNNHYDDEYRHSRDPEKKQKENNENKICLYYLYEECRYKERCRYKHFAKCECISNTSQATGISCCTIIPNTEGVELFTGGPRGILQRWILKIQNDKVASIKADVKTEFSCEVTATVYYCDHLFCSFQDGSIQGFHKQSGSNAKVQSHTKPIYSLLFLDGVLISGSFDGQLKFWKIGGEKSYENISTINIGKRIVSAVPVMYLDNSVERRLLWVIGEGISIIELVSMQIIKSMEDTGIALSIICFRDYVLIGFSNGQIKAFTPTGEETYKHSTFPLYSMTILEHNSESLLAIGCVNGKIEFYRLPDFTHYGTITTKEHKNIKLIRTLSSSRVLTCGSEGKICVWRLTTSNT